MLAILTFVVLLWVLRQPMSLSLGAYFVAQLVCLSVLEPTYRLLGPGIAYGWIYTLVTSLVFLCIGWLTWESLATAKYKLRLLAIASLLALVFARMAFLGLGRPAAWFDWLAIAEGALLVLCGALIGISAPYTRQPDISMGLCSLWLIQALMAFGYSLHWPSWTVIDYYARAIIGMAGFLFIGWRLRSRFYGKVTRGTRFVFPSSR